MGTKIKKELAINAVWLAGLLTVVLALLGGSVFHLKSVRKEVAALEKQIVAKQADLARYRNGEGRRARVEKEEEALRDFRELTHNQTRQAAELYSVARAAGATLVSLRNLGQKTSDDGKTISCIHAVTGAGDFRQLARFLDGIYAARGMAAVHGLKIRPDGDTPGRLRASFRVTWYAPGPAAVFGPEKKEPAS